MLHHTPRFFSCADPTDRAYVRLRDSPDCRELREIVEAEWAVVADFLDPDLPRRAGGDFTGHYWEVYLASALVANGVALAARRNRPRPREGPDIGLADGRTWIEAVAARPGVGPDRVPDLVSGGLAAIPHDAIKLRLLNALDAKRLKRNAYVADDLIDANDAFVVAVNASGIPAAILEQNVPRIVSSVYPIGNEVWHVDRRTARIVDSSFEYQGHVGKVSGSAVPTDGFLSPEYAGVTAALYAWSDIWNRPPASGQEFILVHCYAAASQLPRGALPCGREYWADGERVYQRSYEWPWVAGAQPGSAAVGGPAEGPNA
jgi:hypothetical protein